MQYYSYLDIILNLHIQYPYSYLIHFIERGSIISQAMFYDSARRISNIYGGNSLNTIPEREKKHQLRNNATVYLSLSMCYFDDM